MFDLGTQELIVIFIVAFLVFGPKKLPELGRTLGKGLRELKAAMRGVKDSIEESTEGVTDEIKNVHNDLKDSVYKGMNSQFDFKEPKKGKEDAINKTEKAKEEQSAGEEGKVESETDKDG
jgi:sec-independent protein translocase protein TatB